MSGHEEQTPAQRTAASQPIAIDAPEAAPSVASSVPHADDNPQANATLPHSNPSQQPPPRRSAPGTAPVTASEHTAGTPVVAEPRPRIPALGRPETDQEEYRREAVRRALKAVKAQSGPSSSSRPVGPGLQSKSSPQQQALGQHRTASGILVPLPPADLHPGVHPLGPPPPPGSIPTRMSMLPTGHTPLAQLNAKLLFEKVMTVCDASGHGRMVVPKAAALNHMPLLDESNGWAANMDVTDTAGCSHVLAYRSWANGKSRMYLLEGLRDLQAKYGIGVGDVLVFSELPDKSMCLSGRAGRQGDVSRKPPLRAAAAKKAKKRKANGAWANSDDSDDATEGSFFDPLQDGVFRAVPPGLRGSRARSGPPRVTDMHGFWTAIIDLAGEAYQAFFKNQDSAMESFNVATQHLA